jgi:hypothetical protein
VGELHAQGRLARLERVSLAEHSERRVLMDVNGSRLMRRRWWVDVVVGGGWRGGEGGRGGSE